MPPHRPDRLSARFGHQRGVYVDMMTGSVEVFDVEPKLDARGGREIFDEDCDSLVVRTDRKEAHRCGSSGHRSDIVDLAVEAQ